MDQLALPFPREARPAAVDFVHAPSNDAAITWLDRVADWPQGRLALWGEAGSGKTHLLHRWADLSGAHYLTGPELPGLDVLPDLPNTPGLAIDDADAMAEEATLLHLLNAAAEVRLPVLLAARAPPARWPVRLRDLASRLRAMTAVEILPPDDLLLRVLLARLLSDRQHRVPLATQEWLLTRLPRSPATLREAVTRLDRASLDRAARGHPSGITLRLARDELTDLIGVDLDAAIQQDGPYRAIAGTPERVIAATPHPARAETPDPAMAAAPHPAMAETRVSSARPSPPPPSLL
jgi:chromosomal replication initiation ATPase DnaA